MKTLDRRLSENKHPASEVQSFRRALDQSYAQLRERAAAEWKRRYPGTDPCDACVGVHIAPDSRRRALLS